jgi:hypothetical protein
MKPGLHLLSVPLVVEGEQAVEDCASRDLAHRIALALLCPTECMTQIDIPPIVRSGNGMIQLDMQCSQPSNIL